MNKKIKALVAVGGTGGHVFPGYNLANHLSNSNYNVKLVTDRRGLKFIKDLRDLKVFVLPSSPFIKTLQSPPPMTFFSNKDNTLTNPIITPEKTEILAK